MSADLAGKVDVTCGVTRSSSGGLAAEPLKHVSQSWDCPQKREQPEVADAMDWLMDNEMMRHWEDVSKEEEEILVKRSEGGSRK